MITGFNPEIDEKDICPFGGGHKFIFDKIIEAQDKIFEDIKCSACGFISRGWYFKKDYEKT